VCQEQNHDLNSLRQALCKLAEKDKDIFSRFQYARVQINRFYSIKEKWVELESDDEIEDGEDLQIYAYKVRVDFQKY